MLCFFIQDAVKWFYLTKDTILWLSSLVVFVVVFQAFWHAELFSGLLYKNAPNCRYGYTCVYMFAVALVILFCLFVCFHDPNDCLLHLHHTSFASSTPLTLNGVHWQSYNKYCVTVQILMTDRDPGHTGQTILIRLTHFCSQIPGLHNRTKERQTIRNHILTNDVTVHSLPASISDAAPSPPADSAEASGGTAEGALPLPQHQAGYWIGLCILVTRPCLQSVRSQIYHTFL